jgi:hypothetical protein
MPGFKGKLYTKPFNFEQVYTLVLLDLPGLIYFPTYTLFVLFWAEIYYQVLHFEFFSFRFNPI